jgi:hypothetical protein
VDGADSAVNTVGTVGDPHLLDQELVVPDYDNDETAESPAASANPAACIAEFKAKREKRERVALGAVFNALLVLVSLSVAGLAWVSYDHNPETNPFVTSKNGTITFTSTGTSVHLLLWSSKQTVVSAIVSVPLDLEAFASEVRWADIAAGRVPQAVSVLTWAFFALVDPLSMGAIYAKFGLWSVLLPAVVLLKLVIWKFEFAVQPGDKHLLLRQSTGVEQYTLSVFAFTCSIYPGFVRWCIKDRQWDGKTVGRFGGLMLMLLQLASVVVWWIKRAKVRRCDLRPHQDLCCLILMPRHCCM